MPGQVAASGVDTYDVQNGIVQQAFFGGVMWFELLGTTVLI